MEEIRRLQQLRQDELAVEGGVGGVVGAGAVVVLEQDKAGVFDAVALRGRAGKNDAFGNAALGGELHLVIGLGEMQNSLGDGLALRVHGPDLFEGGVQLLAELVHRERVLQFGQEAPAEAIGQAQFEELALE